MNKSECLLENETHEMDHLISPRRPVLVSIKKKKKIYPPPKFELVLLVF